MSSETSHSVIECLGHRRVSIRFHLLSTCCGFEKKTILTIFQDFNSIFQTFSRSGKLLYNFKTFSIIQDSVRAMCQEHCTIWGGACYWLTPSWTENWVNISSRKLSHNAIWDNTTQYSPLWGCAGDRVGMVVKLHCGTVLGDEFSTWRQIRPRKQSHNALWQPSRPGLQPNLKVANCRQSSLDEGK